MTTEVDSVVEEFLANDKAPHSKPTPFIQEENSSVATSIPQFYAGQNVLITGVTGFLGGLLLEKLLRTCPEIGSIYVLIRENRKCGEKAESRLKKLFSSTIFYSIKEQDFSKVVAIPGDISVAGLGLSAAHCQMLRNRVSIVFHVAASINFGSTLPNALNTNVLGTRRIVRLCQLLKNIKALVYVSTAYCNCTVSYMVAEEIYPTVYDADTLIKSLSNLTPAQVAEVTPRILSGHPNTYSFTKLVAENLILKERGRVPVAIIRPSIVLGTLHEPVPGWVDNVHNGAVAFIAGAGKGVFRTVLADPELITDIVPCDLVVNLMITAAPHIYNSNESLRVFHMTSGHRNPLQWKDYVGYVVDGIRRSPCIYPVWYPGAKCSNSVPWFIFKLFFTHYIPAVVLLLIERFKGRKHILLPIQNKYVRGMFLTSYFTTKQWIFNTSNTEALAATLSEADLKTFNFDVDQISWPEYLANCADGVRQYYHKEGPKLRHKALRHQTRTWMIDMVTKGVMFLVFFFIFQMFWASKGACVLAAVIATYIVFFV